ncbi:MAG TPA: DNA-protecting protein DprA [Sedimenticola sp.]|nr:DNA-protecting protein DprA [Sedimenticola sp.]
MQWLTLVRAPGLGGRRLLRLLSACGGPAGIIVRAEGPGDGGEIPAPARAWLRSPDRALLERDCRWLEQPAHHLVTLDDARYPPLLADIPDPPPVLFVNGDPALLSSPQIALVGSRNPTASGRRTARDFARALATAGVTITSGLATGIDGAGHEGALAAGGATLAVTGTGPDRLYPSDHRELAHRIAATGALVTEYPPGTPARRGHFPRRNRIISGLSLGTLVVEAARGSGSLITARLAGEQGREVFAIPGSIHNPLARGCHALIREGAKLVETAGDIFEELGPHLGRPDALDLSSSTAAPADDREGGETPVRDAEYRKLLGCLGFDPLPADLLIRCSGLTAEEVSSMLLLLELEGYVSSEPGGRYCLTGKGPA